MLANINEHKFNQVVSDAIVDAITKSKTEYAAKRWTRAIERAADEINSNPYMSWSAGKEEMLILSPTSNKIYVANGSCQCRAYQQKQPCWHRAAARLWRTYLKTAEHAETVSNANVSPSPRLEILNMPYLPNTPVRRLETLGGVRF